MHLAVRSVETLDSCRPVRALLIKGAEPMIKDKSGKLPVDYINPAAIRTGLENELRSLLESHSRSLKSVIKGTPPPRKVGRTTTTMMIYHLIIWCMQAIKVTTIYPRISFGLGVASIVADSLAYLFHILLTCKDPGYIKNDGLEFMKLLETFDAQSLCPECEIIRTGRSRHCVVCRKCVDRYDHHCPWLNNCVGLCNHNLFLAYLILQQSSIIFTLTISIMTSI